MSLSLPLSYNRALKEEGKGMPHLNILNTYRVTTYVASLSCTKN